MSVNKVILIGRAGKDPEFRQFDNNQVATISLATSEHYKDKEGKKVETTEWHRVVIWGKQAEIAEKYIKKGSQVYVEGKNKTRSYDDKDGKKVYITEVVCDTFRLLDSKRESESERREPMLPNDPDNDITDDLPF
jgi:single-strand DNA-binding protein